MPALSIEEVCADAGLTGYIRKDPKLKKTVFDNRNDAEAYLKSNGYHETAPYARSYRAKNFTRDLLDGNRYEAWIETERGKYVIKSEGPEPNPEATLAGIAKNWWPLRALKWHLKC